MRKFLSVLLMLCLIAGMLPMAALAAPHKDCTDGDSCTQHEAAIGSTHYDTIEEAITAANSKGKGVETTIKLLKDSTMATNQFLKNQITLILDLNSHKLTSTSEGGITIGTPKQETEGSNLTLKNGIYENTHQNGTALWGFIHGSITIESTAAVKAADAGIITGFNDISSGGTVIKVYGTIECGGTAIWGQGPKNEIYLDGASVTGGEYGIYHNSSFGGSKIEVKSSTVKATEQNSVGIYLANNETSAADSQAQGRHTLTVTDSTIEGTWGIGVQYTDVDISGDKTQVTAQNNALEISRRETNETDGKTLGDMNITGGKFTGQIYVEEDKDQQTSSAQLTISGGTFQNVNGEKYDVSEYYSSGLTQDENGTVIVDPGEAVAKIGNVNYLTLTGALGKAQNGDTVILLQNAELSQAITSGVTLEVPKDVTLTINDLTTVAGSEGKLKVDAGGTLDVGGTNMIGGSDANINLTEGHIEIDKEADALALNFVGATAEIPLGKRWTTVKTVGQTQVPMNVALDENTTLTVSSTNNEDGFRVANNSTLTNNGKVVVNGVMSISSHGAVNGDGTIQIGSKGVLEVKAAGTNVGTLENNVTNKGTFVWNGADATSPTDTITLGSGGKVYSQVDLSNKLGGSISGTSNKTYNGKTYAYAWEYYVAPTTPTTPTTPTEPEEPEKDSWPFVDVAEGAWYYEAVKCVYENGLMAGTGDDTFSPNVTLSRAMVAQILYNLEGKPDVATEDSFTDAAGAGQWAVKAIAWAKQTGVVSGYEDGTFRPSNAVSREELAQMLYNYAQYKQIILPAVGDLSKFPDGEEVSSWAETAMSWATGLGVINGYEDETLRPGGSTTRAEAASMIKGVAETLTK